MFSSWISSVVLVFGVGLGTWLGHEIATGDIDDLDPMKTWPEHEIAPEDGPIDSSRPTPDKQNGSTSTDTQTGNGSVSDDSSGPAGMDTDTTSGSSGVPPTENIMCGDSKIDAPEVCDGTYLNEENCVSRGYVGGNLTCQTNCRDFDESSCYAQWWGDNFESGVSLGDEWVTGDALKPKWSILQKEGRSGGNCAQSGSTNNSQRASMSVDLNFLKDGSVTFWRYVESERNIDILRFYIDGKVMSSWSGMKKWAQFSYPLSAGRHTLKWVYSKDSSFSHGKDRALIDDITTEGGVL